MRRLLLLVMVLHVFASPAWARVDIILDEGVSTYLSHLVSAERYDDEEVQQSYEIGSLILNSGASLYLTQSSLLRAHHIELKPQAKIHMLNGGTLKIHTNIFDGGYRRAGQDALGIVSVEQHPYFFHPPPKISSFPLRERARMDAQFTNRNQWSAAEPGLPGRRGSQGDKGATAGNIHLKAEVFYGGLFLARGGIGQQGGRGEEGGPGGNGYRFPNSINYFPGHSIANPFPYDMRVLHGTDGGAPGIGGDGGNGGDSGFISISVEKTESVTDGVNFIYVTSAGTGGEVGEAGSSGVPGQAGRASLFPIGSRLKESYIAPDSSELVGQQGRENNGPRGTNKPGEIGQSRVPHLEGF
ncbi:MAG TPA: hypothetical protein VJB34_10525 [Bdellovibrionota bacterium]|nr:hypothetical protein [Bdellovibrionota bacterium]